MLKRKNANQNIHMPNNKKLLRKAASHDGTNSKPKREISSKKKKLLVILSKKAKSIFGNDNKPSRTISKKEQRLRIILSGIFFVFTVWLLAPIVSRILHEGMYFAAISGGGFLLSVSPKLYDLVFKKSKVFSRILTVMIVIGLTVLLVIFSLLIYGGVRPTQQNCTVIVLGCKVNGEKPSLMLQRRIDVAYEYALKNPDCKIIATGGQGSNENISEGECIKRSLIKLGIDPERIYVEDKSINTAENLRYAAEIIERESLSKEVVIATSRFHQYRASLNAKKAGLNSSPLPCNTLVWLAPGYWFREVIGMLRWIILGY